MSRGEEWSLPLFGRSTKEFAAIFDPPHTIGIALFWESEEWIYNSICQETPVMKISKSTESTLWLPWWDEALVSENVLALIAKLKNFKRTVSGIRVLDDFHFDLWAVFPLVGSDREKHRSLAWNNLQCYLNSFISFYTAKLKPTFW